MNFSTFRKLSESFGDLNKIILYGLGEPLAHERFVDIVKLTREKLGDEGKIDFSTNGSMLTGDLANKLIRSIGVNKISFSLDTLEHSYLEKFRVGTVGNNIIENLVNISKIKSKSKFPFSLSIEVTLMKDNYKDLPNLIEFAVENGIDDVLVTNLIVYSQILNGQQLYIPSSRKSYEIVGNVLDKGWEIIHAATVGAYGLTHTGKYEQADLERYRNLWERAENEGCWINLPLLLKMRDQLDRTKEVEDVFEKSSRIARKGGVNLELPSIFADRKSRACPYIENEVMVVRADGSAVPCLEYMYPHTEYVNHHAKDIDMMAFGNVKGQSVKDIWNSDEYIGFRESRKSIDENIPWCGDCVYSTLDCFYIRSNEIDCQRIEGSCCECLYSTNIVKCML